MSQALLPKELMELQLGQVDLLMAMYASDDAVIIDETSLGMVESLRRWCEGVDDGTPPLLTESSIQLVLRLEIPEEEGGPRGESLQLEITFPVVSHDERKTAAETLEEPPKAKIRLRQPDWMSKAETWRLSDDIPGDEDMLTAIDHVRESASRHLQESRLTADVATSAGGEQDGSTDRTWFYFPSISTRSKRQDIVNYAPRYGLTGFLLAGKPGILCLEGGARAIDDYMRCGRRPGTAHARSGASAGTGVGWRTEDAGWSHGGSGDDYQLRDNWLGSVSDARGQHEFVRSGTVHMWIS